MNKVNVIIAVAIASLTLGVWAILNMPEMEPPWPERIQGFAFQPMHADQSPIDGILPTTEEIEQDLALLKGKTYAIRTYTVEGIFGTIPFLARKYNINVALGAWIDDRYDHNDKEIKRLIDITATSWRNVVRLIVGNEVVLRKDIPIEKLIIYLDRVRAAVNTPVSTAEPWHVWLAHPELAQHVDYLAVHMLPYWEQIHIDNAVDYVADKMNKLKAAFPNKPIIITEVGWPSNGRTRGSAVASESNEATFLRRFLNRARKEQYTYYVMEAFDQPWKQVTGGAVEAYWGVYNVDRQPKFEFSKPIVMIPGWYLLALISVFIAAITFSMLLVDSHTLRKRGRSFLAVIAYLLATAAVWVVYSYSHQYLSVFTVLIGILLIIGMVGVIVVVLIEAHEWAEALWSNERRRAFVALQVADDELMKVSIHLPIHNEPADMVIETLNALSALDYPCFEVIVIDNNTINAEVWEAVQSHCDVLGDEFRFFHLDDWPGYKAGALNFAMEKTSADAEIVAVIDSDYLVDPAWLRDLTPQFLNRKTAIVQAPQDYRDSKMSAFKAMCYNEYRGFFFIGMVTRNERNAIIQHGTMTMIRKNVLVEVGGWGEWCITEDAELGLRIFEYGYDAVYISKSYGRGLTPDTFIDYKKQRFRWAYGAMQIMKHHIRELLGKKPTKLSKGQRFHFFAGWLPWIADGANLLFTTIALMWSAGMILYADIIDPPLIMFSLLPITLFCFKAAKVVYLYRGIQVVGSGLQILSATLAGLALSHTVAKAMITGLFTRDIPFFRTPKRVNTNHIFAAINAAREEVLLMILLWGAAYFIAMRDDSNTLDLVFWIIVLLVQSIPYCASLLLSLVSVMPSTTSK